MEKESFYIGGKQYMPTASYLLCTHRTGKHLADIVGTSEELYITKKGKTFFKVTRGGSFNEVEDAAEILTKEEAQKFMDKHTGGVIRETYDAVFGVPEID